MKLVTRIKIYGTALAVVAAMVLWFTATSDKQPCSKDNQMVLSVKWQPGTLSIQRPVHITATVDGVPLVTKNLHVSPWGQTMTACHDALVVLTAQTSHPSVHLLDCIILRDGKIGGRKGYDSIKSPGSVRCES